MDKIFNYDYNNNLVKKLTLKSRYPLQVELQPGRGCGIYKCPYCYGLDQPANAREELTIDHYHQLFSDIRGKVDLVTISGIRSEPLSSRHIIGIIKAIKLNKLNVGINTKGYLLSDKLIQALTDHSEYGDFITFSLDSSQQDVYNKIHGIDKGFDALTKVIGNMRAMYAAKKQNDLKINVNASCLLFQENSAPEQIEHFIQTFGGISDKIRFSFPQTPNISSIIPGYYVKDRDSVVSVINSLKAKYKDYNIFVLKFDSDNHGTTFKYCAAQRFLFAVDYCGNVYPCPQITVKDYADLIVGNLQDQSFEEILNSEKRKKLLATPVDDMKCRVCDRKDESINVFLDKVFGGNYE